MTLRSDDKHAPSPAFEAQARKVFQTLMAEALQNYDAAMPVGNSEPAAVPFTPAQRQWLEDRIEAAVARALQAHLCNPRRRG